MKKLSIFSFFSGVGILDLAFEFNKYEVVFVNEFNNKHMNAYKYSRESLNVNRPIYGYSEKSACAYTKGKNKKRLIEMINKERAKGNLVGFIGGPPCPDFSVAGKNMGYEGKNGKLTKVYFDLICRCKPDFFLFENVKGLVKTEKHKKFYNEMKKKIAKNHFVISDKVVNALSYSVPQHRERIMMIGINNNILKSGGIKIEENLSQFTFPWDRHASYSAEKILKMNWPVAQTFSEDCIREFCYDVPKNLTVEYWFEKNQVTLHPNHTDQFKVKNGRRKIFTFMEGDTKRKSFKRLHRWKYSPTAAYGNNEVHLHPYKPRRLSVAEAMAIQTLPKEFELPSDITITHKFKVVGNGVPFLMAHAISKTLYEVLFELIFKGEF